MPGGVADVGLLLGELEVEAGYFLLKFIQQRKLVIACPFGLRKLPPQFRAGQGLRFVLLCQPLDIGLQLPDCKILPLYFLQQQRPGLPGRSLGLGQFVLLL